MDGVEKRLFCRLAVKNPVGSAGQNRRGCVDGCGYHRSNLAIWQNRFADSLLDIQRWVKESASFRAVCCICHSGFWEFSHRAGWIVSIFSPGKAIGVMRSANCYPQAAHRLFHIYSLDAAPSSSSRVTC